MKLAKRIMTAGVALALTLGLNIPAFAATITVKKTTEGETYSAYKLFDVTVSGTNYSYSTKDGNLVNELKKIGLTFTTSADGATYYIVTDAAGENFVTDQKVDPDGIMTATELAEALNADNVNLGIAVATETVGAGQTSVTLGDGQGVGDVSSLDSGYYFVTSSVGSLCFLQTNDSSVNIDEKNEAPKVEKDVTTPTNNDTVEVGDVLNYTITVTTQDGAEGYVVHDQMTDGLTLNKDVVVKVGEVTLTEGAGGQYTINYNPTESEEDPDCVFEITFDQDYLDSLADDTVIVITYSATVNSNAVIGTNPETNQAILDYGENSHVKTDEGKTEVYTYDFDLTKVDDSEEPVQLDGAQFKLYDQATDGTAIQFIYTPADEANPASKDSYRVAMANEEAPEGSTKTDTITAGSVTIQGLAGKTYYLEEIKAPNGYNMLDHRVEVKFNKKDGVVTENPTLDQMDLADQKVENVAGTKLPSTGGMGTTILYIAGAALVLGAGVTLVVRRRMNSDR